MSSAGGCRLAGLIPLRVGGADTLLGVSAGLGGGGIPLGPGGGHPLISLGASLPHRFVPLVLRGGGTPPGGLGEGLRVGQVLAHLLGGAISLGAELLSGRGALLGGCGAGFGGGGALLGGGADRFPARQARVMRR